MIGTQIFTNSKNIWTFHSTKNIITTYHLCHWTYPDKDPVTEVVDGAEEPELVEEKIGSCHNALVWKK